ncbi:MAG TPA: MFS transporter [Spirochaetales bacterium]|nr:MFS transporter [Spirochaetales bacterium]
MEQWRKNLYITWFTQILSLTGFIMVLLVTKEITIEEPEHDNTTTTFSLKAMLIRPFPILFILIFLVRFSRMLAVPFIPLYIQEVRQSMQGISAITGIISALAGLSTALAGLTIVRLGDKYNRLLLIAIFLGMGSIFSLPIFFTHGLVYFTIFYLAAIFFVGAIEPLMQAFLSANIHPDNRGVILGLQASAGSFGWFLSPLAASSISIYFSIKHIFLFFSISLFINFVIVSIYNRKMK